MGARGAASAARGALRCQPPRRGGLPGQFGGGRRGGGGSGPAQQAALPSPPAPRRLQMADKMAAAQLTAVTRTGRPAPIGPASL